MEHSIFVGVVAYLFLAPIYFLYIIALFISYNKLFVSRKFLLFTSACTVSIVLASLCLAYVNPNTKFGAFIDNFYINLISNFFIGSFAFLIKFTAKQVSRETELVQIKAQQVENELKLIKQQINPHFLFNTLNSVYLNSLTDSGKTSTMIIQLSDMLRYLLESQKKVKISVQDEIAFLKNYIYFEKLRVAENVTVEDEIYIDSDRYLIIPNIIIAPVKNCFKHGIIASELSPIYIKLRVEAGILVLQTKNRFLEKRQVSAGFGIGHESLTKILEYYYPDNYNIDIKINESFYEIHLRIKL
jgi:LytS/YehU family sensor histidine kinase